MMIIVGRYLKTKKKGVVPETNAYVHVAAVAGVRSETDFSPVACRSI